MKARVVSEDHVKDLRFASISQKLNSDNPSVYYEKQIEDSDYYIGGST